MPPWAETSFTYLGQARLDAAAVQHAADGLGPGEGSGGHKVRDPFWCRLIPTFSTLHDDTHAQVAALGPILSQSESGKGTLVKSTSLCALHLPPLSDL
jgi:hypothetical protein